MVNHIISGLFGWTLAPSSALNVSGNAAQYAFNRFQAYPMRNVIDGNGVHTMGELRLTSVGLVALQPAGPPEDVIGIPSGEPMIGETPLEVSVE